MPVNDITDRRAVEPGGDAEEASREASSSEKSTAEPRAGESLLGAPPAIEDFDEIRARMRARLLDVDPCDVETSPEPWSSPKEEAPPERIGRYAIRSVLGRGGMGVVYLAHDASLGRDLALKLLRDPTQAAPGEHLRLRREARAMARLSHPNVVMIHEVDEHEGRLFIAMEYVRGLSLSRWLESAQRPWREILEVVLAAGEGLIAAHAAGIVHRDFKPDNVLVGEDGRVRVADFGLAFTAHHPLGEAAPTGSISTDDSTREEEVDLRQTKKGTVLGTLAFMAPEQYRGEPPSFAADQFSFAATLYRALYGHLPFDASSTALYQVRVRAGEIRPEPAKTSVPRWLRAALLRGLSADKDRRWESLAALVHALRRRSRFPRWAPTLALGCLALGGLTTLGTVSALGSAPETYAPCRPIAEVLAGVWDAETRTRLEARFTAAGEGADEARAWRTIDVALGIHSDRWAIEHTRACQIQGAADSDQTRAARDVLACLDDQREELAAFVVHIDRDGLSDVASAVLLATGLPAPELCRQAPPRARAPGAGLILRTRLLAARRRLSRAAADVDLGRLSAARSTIEDVLEIAEELDAGGLEAEALLTLGRAQRSAHEIEAAHASLLRARERVQGRPEARALEIRILIQLVDVTGVGLGELPLAESLAEEAAALSLSLGNPSLLEAYLANNLARAHRAHRRYDDAHAGYLAAYTLLKQTLGDSAPETIAVRTNLGVVTNLLGEPEAVAILEHALEQQLSVLGEFHPRTPSILRSLGNALGRRGDYERAEELLRRAVDLRPRLHGAQSPKLAGDRISLARTLRGLDRLDDADAVLAQAESMGEGARKQVQAQLDRERLALAEAIEARSEGRAADDP